jgi:hypothetical protein
MLSNSEKQLGIIRDIILPLDINTRYDVYFTDKRIAIICMGRANRFESDKSAEVSVIPSPFGVPPITSSYIEKTENKQSIDQEIKNLSIDELLKLSKKSCFYSYDEIEEVRLILGSKPKFIILSKECESKFFPDDEQFKRLSEILPSIETLRNKFSIAGSWNKLQEIFKASFGKSGGSENDLDAIDCQSYGKKTMKDPIKATPITELTCSCCGTKNEAIASFCKQCGAYIGLDNKAT